MIWNSNLYSVSELIIHNNIRIDISIIDLDETQTPVRPQHWKPKENDLPSLLTRFLMWFPRTNITLAHLPSCLNTMLRPASLGYVLAGGGASARDHEDCLNRTGSGRFLIGIGIREFIFLKATLLLNIIRIIVRYG